MKLWPCNSVCVWVLLYYRVGRWKRPSRPSNPSSSPCRSVPHSTFINVVSRVVFSEPNNWGSVSTAGTVFTAGRSRGQAACSEIHGGASFLNCVSLFLLLLQVTTKITACLPGCFLPPITCRLVVITVKTVCLGLSSIPWDPSASQLPALLFSVLPSAWQLFGPTIKPKNPFQTQNGV